MGRTKTDGPQDYDAVHKIQEGYKITPLCQWGQASEPVEAKIDPTVDMKIPPKIQVDTMGRLQVLRLFCFRSPPPEPQGEPRLERVNNLVAIDFVELDPLPGQ
jgi:hypothetical protein